MNVQNYYTPHFELFSKYLLSNLRQMKLNLFLKQQQKQKGVEVSDQTEALILCIHDFLHMRPVVVQSSLTITTDITAH